MNDWIKGLVVANTHWTENLFSLQIDAQVEDFKAGQYTTLGLDVNGHRSAQPYSILSAPQRQPLEFFLYTNLDGELSTQLARLGSGDEVWVKSRPEGLFTLEQVADAEDLWLLATGTGVAPFLSMLLSEEIWERFAHVVLVYAARTQRDICYHSLISEFQRNRGQQFSFVPMISREQHSDSLAGRIPQAISSGALERQAGRKLTPESSQVMLCGNPGMVQDANHELKARGFTENSNNRSGQITFESYW